MSNSMKSQALHVLVSIAVTLFTAVVLVSLWGWFVVPIGAPAITWAHAWGLGMLGSLLSGTPRVVAYLYQPIEASEPGDEEADRAAADKDRNERTMREVALGIGVASVWLTGALAHYLMGVM